MGFVVTGVLDREQYSVIGFVGKLPQQFEPSHCPARRGPICGIGRREGWTWLCHQPQRKLPTRSGVDIDKVLKRFRNVATVNIAAALNFEGHIF